MDMNKQEQFQDFIAKLVQSQNELIKELGMTGIHTEKTPVDDIWSDIMRAVRSAKDSTLNVIEREVTRATQQAIMPLQVEIEKLKSQITEKEGIIQGLNDKISNQKEEFDKTILEMKNEHRKEISNLNETHQNKLDKKKEEFDKTILEMKNEHRKEISNLNETNQNKLDKNKEEFDKTILEMKNEHQKEISNLNETHQNELNMEKKNMEDAVKEIKEATENEKNELISQNENNLDKIRKELSEKDMILQEYTELTTGYSELLKKVCTCITMSDYCKNCEITNESSMNMLFRFIERVGTGTGFARTVKNSILRYRKEHQSYTPLSKNEIDLISEINSFYHKKFGDKLTEDVLYLPTGFTAEQTEGVKVLFKPDEMKNVNSGPLPKYATTVYTPCYKGIDNTFDEAYVKGISEG